MQSAQDNASASDCLNNPDAPKFIGYATLHITDYKLGNLATNQRAWFESMKFTVTGDYSPPQDNIHKVHQGSVQ